MKPILTLSLLLLVVLVGLAQAEFIARGKYVGPRRRTVSPRRLYSSRIVNGVPSRIEDHPHHVALHDHWMGLSVYFCGGSIIAPRYVLSAAHCLRGAWPEDLSIKAGSSNRYDGAEFLVDNFWLHPQFDSRTLERDLGIMFTDRVMSGPNIAVVRLPTLCNTGCCGVCQGTNTTVTGFGRTEQGSSTPWLREVSKPVFNFAECDRIWRITDGMFCTDSTHGDSCAGDSGGPVVDNNNVQHGVVSFGSENCDGSAPAVYVRLEAPINLNWINLIINPRA